MAIGTEIYDQLARFGVTPQALGIPDRLTHGARLRCAAVMLQRANARQVLDFGCGFGDLWSMLSPEIDYLGTDARPAMLREACRRYPGDPAVFQTPDQVQGRRFETVVALGVLVTVRPYELKGFMSETLGALAIKRLVISWIPAGKGARAYKGVFNTHAMADICAGWHCVNQREVTGEITALLERTA
jgi:hypothetical protein